MNGSGDCSYKHNIIQSWIGRKLRFGKHNIELFRSIIESDTKFLARLNIMDYSLLVSRLFRLGLVPYIEMKYIVMLMLKVISS
jgi:hypothetical protein